MNVAKKAVKSFDSWRRRTNGQRKKGGDRYEYDGPEGEIRALRDYMDIYENKTCYATPIAEEIVSIDDEQRCVPSNIRTLFKRLDAVLHHYEDETHD